MKKILIVSNEESLLSLGRISNSSKYGLPEEIYNISNLAEQIESLGEYETAVIHHTKIEKVNEIQPDCVILSGRFSAKALSSSDISTEYKKLIAWIREAKFPILGICMGLQLICAAYCVGTKRLASDDGEYGFKQLRLQNNHPLLQDLPQYMYLLELHRCEAESLPEEFDLLASSELCNIQMIMHKCKPIIGTQFHPELLTAEHTDGKLLLKRILHALSA